MALRVDTAWAVVNPYVCYERNKNDELRIISHMCISHQIRQVDRLVSTIWQSRHVRLRT